MRGESLWCFLAGGSECSVSDDLSIPDTTTGVVDFLVESSLVFFCLQFVFRAVKVRNPE